LRECRALHLAEPVTATATRELAATEAALNERTTLAESLRARLKWVRLCAGDQGMYRRVRLTLGLAGRGSQRRVNHRLVPRSSRIRFGSEVLNDVVIEHDGNSSLSWRGNDWASFAFGEIVLLTHDIGPLHRR